MDHVDKILAQWAVERPDLDTGPMGTLGRLTRVRQVIMDRVEGALTDFDLNAASFDVMATLLRSGPPHALTPSQLVEWTMVTSGTMTNRLDRLEDKGLIERRPNPNDGRGSVVALTPEGLDLIRRAATAHVANQHRVMEGLSPEDRAAIDRILKLWLAELGEST